MAQDKRIDDGLVEFLNKHETFQLALTEAVHRYYNSKCFGKDGKFKDDDEAKFISVLLNNLWCTNPDWRYKLKKRASYYFGEASILNSVLIEDKPEYRIETKIDLTLLMKQL